MRLQEPTTAADFTTEDIHGEPLRLSELRGQRVMLSFFRDAACPFCNLRLYELTQQYAAWKEAGLTVIAVFSSPAGDVRQFVARRPRPFFLLSDPDLAIYNRYGVEQSASALFKALLFRLPRIAGGIAKGGRPRPNPHVRLVPADFLIDEGGRIVETWYGNNTSDHIPLERVHAFAENGRRARESANARDAERLAETRQGLEQLRKKYASLETQCEHLQGKVAVLSREKEMLNKILAAYKHSSGGHRDAMEAVRQSEKSETG